MQRLLALMVGLAFVGAAAQISALHTHAYTDHDHPEHHHGPAAHEHPQVVAQEPAHPDQDHDAAHIESCDAGQHTVAITLFCPSLPRVDTFDLPFANIATLDRPAPVSSAYMLADVRVHGPPPLSRIPARAPPSISPA